LALASVLLMAPSCQHFPEGTSRFTMMHGGVERSYWVHVPPAYTGDDPVPLLIALHPFSLTGGDMEAKSGFDAVADREGFIVCYPDAILRIWNGDPTDEADAPGNDDVGFIDALIDQLAIDYAIDSDKIYIA